MATGEKKLSALNAITSIPNDALMYVVIGGVSYKTTKANFLAGISSSIAAYATFVFVKKGFGNTGTTPGAEGDVYQGWVSDGVYSTHAVYDGSGPLDDPDSFEHKQLIEY